MITRTIAAVCLLMLLVLAGCSAQCQRHIGRAPPSFKLCNGSRLSYEFLWFYSDIQDVFFGIEPYQDTEALYGAGPYEATP